MNTISPAIIAKDQQELNYYLRKLKGVSQWLHLDIVDGKFANNHSLDFPFRLSKRYKYSAHLMVKNQEQWILKLHDKIDLLIPQFEEVIHPHHLICYLKKHHQKIAFALKPETKVDMLKHYVKDADYILVLTVHPGFYGSAYLPADLKKIRQLKKINSNVKVIIDGGMNPGRIKQGAKAGADYFITGSYTTKADDPRKALGMLKKAVKQ